MAEQSAFLTAYDEMQKKKGGFNAPAPLESVVDTVGQEPAVQSPFSQASALNPMAAAVNPMAQPDVLAAAPAVQSPVEMATPASVARLTTLPKDGVYDQFDAGIGQLGAGSPMGNLIEDLPGADVFFNPLAAGMAKVELSRLQRENALRENAQAQPYVSAAAPTVQTPAQVGLSPEERARIETRLARTNADIVASGETVGGAPQEGFVSKLAGRLGEQFTQPAPYTPLLGGAESETAFGATPTQPTLFQEGLSAMGELNKTPLTRPDSYGAKAPETITEASQVTAPVMDGSQIPKAGEAGFKFAERGSPQDYFLSQTNDGTTPLSPEKIARGQEYAKQHGLNFDPTTGFSQGTGAPQVQAPQAQLPSAIQSASGQDLIGFKPKYKGQSLTDYMAGRDDPSAASVQVQDPQGRFRRQAASVAGETPEQNQARTDALFPGQADFQRESAAREARQAARPDFGEAQERAAGTVTDRERRAARGDDMSDADRRDIAKANQPGASASDIARGDKVAALNGIDRKTGEPLEGGDLTFDQQLKLRSQKLNEGKFEYEITKDAKELYDTSLTEAKEAKTAEAKAESVGKGLASSVADMRDVMGRASGRLDGFFSTDMVGKAASFWKGSDADAQESDFAFLKSNVALNAMMELKANSPTGSTGFGALNTEELKVLTNQFATLDPFTDPKLVRQNLKQLNERFEGIIQNAYNTHAAEYGKEAADSVYGSMMGGKQAQGQSNQAPSGKSVTTASGRFTATAVID